MKIFVVIPAKMTSVRLPKKNMADFCGKPLLYYSIAVAKHIDGVDCIYVSSEDCDVVAYAEKEGCTGFLRPEELSLPHVTTKDVLNHVYDQISCEGESLFVLLQPTHPLRFPSDISDAIRIMSKTEIFDTVFSVVKTDELRGTIEKNCFVPEFPLPRNKINEPEMYRNTGSFYVFRPKKTFLTDNFFGDKIYPFILKYPQYEIDIDYASDLELARLMLKSNRHKFPHF